MTDDPYATPDAGWFLQRIDVATDRLLGSLRGLDDESTHRPSLLPGWSRAHVLAHLAQQVDAMVNLLEWARTGEPVAAYRSQEARDTAVEEGARQDHAALVAAVHESAGRFRAAALGMPAPAWAQPVHILSSREFPAGQLLVRRWCELELHHVDLAVGYGPADWPAEFVALELGEPMQSQRADRLAVAGGT